MALTHNLHWRHFGASAHRMFFFGGVWALVLAVLWWGAVLLATPAASPAPHWIHGWLMVFCAVPFFAFGFLLTALPRWLKAPAVAATFYRPAALVLMAGFVLVLMGASWWQPLALLGMVLTALGWLACISVLARCLWQSQADSRLHPVWAVAVLGIGLAAAVLAVQASWSHNLLNLRLAPRIGLWAFLAPLVFVVSHRMLPFFARAALGEHYPMVRPHWLPPIVIALLWLHALLMLLGHGAWVFVTDAPLLALTAGLLLCWRPWQTRHNPLLWSLFLGFAWLPVALALSLAQSAARHFAGVYILGLAPLHALAIGMAASMVFAMATRVSLGHSGRALRMPRLAVTCFCILQLAALARIGAELHGLWPGRSTWLALSTVFWLCAFTPWALRLSLIYWQPRIDGRAG